MRSATTYLPARIVSSRLETHFAEQLELAKALGTNYIIEPLPAELMESLIDVGFWISLRKEEGFSPNISLALLKPEHSKSPLVFGFRIPLTPANLIKLSPAVGQEGIHLGVWFENDDLYVWGTTQYLPSACFVLQVMEPAVLVVKHKRLGGFGKFVNVVILRGDVVKFVDEKNRGLTDYPSLLHSLLGMPLPSSLDKSVNILVELSTAMRAHKRGALLLVVPSDSTRWMESIAHPISFPVQPSFVVIKDLMEQEPQLRDSGDWQETLLKAIDVIGGFSAADGATIVTQKYELLAFGAKIARAQGGRQVEEIIYTEPVADAEVRRIQATKIGGTRHLAAAQFVFDQPGSMALVASQDGRFTIFVWSSEVKMVHAHRIDCLLI